MTRDGLGGLNKSQFGGLWKGGDGGEGGKGRKESKEVCGTRGSRKSIYKPQTFGGIKDADI